VGKRRRAAGTMRKQARREASTSDVDDSNRGRTIGRRRQPDAVVV
jgi:hypothetical protein